MPDQRSLDLGVKFGVSLVLADFTLPFSPQIPQGGLLDL